MKKNWQIKDLIDLEHFLGLKFRDKADENAPDGIDFDRRTYLSFTGAEESVDETDYRKRLIRHWLEKRRDLHKSSGKDPGPLPGDAFSEAMRATRLLIGVIALVFGAGLAWGLLSYTGREPVNVFTLLWVLVVPQVFLLIALALSAALRKTRVRHSFQVVYPAFSTLMRDLVMRLSRFAGKRVDARRANRIRETYALLGKTGTVYGSVFFWPVFVSVQLFAILFNIGLLAAIFLKVAITDLAFGWQTTLQLGSESVLRFVETVALPWSWIVSPPMAHPTLEQIAGSQMILKDGILHLATGDLVAWWPFIFLTILFYGLLPRLLLAGAGLIMKNRALRSIDFSHGACDRLVMRMKSPMVGTRQAPYQSKQAEARDDVTIEPGTAGGMEGNAATVPAIVLVPAEILANLQDAGLEKTLYEAFGFFPALVIPADMDARTDSSHLRKVLAENQDKGVSLRIVIVQEAWQPPIRENVSWIKALRTAGGGTAGMIIILIGKPDRDTVFTAPAAVDKSHWEQSINSLKDPYLRIETLGG